MSIFKDEFLSNTVVNFITRHATTLIILLVTNIVLAIYYGVAYLDVIFSFIVAVQATALAIFMSNIAVYAYTKLDFTSSVILGDDKKLNGAERYAYVNVLGHIFLGICVLIAVTSGLMFMMKIGI